MTAFNASADAAASCLQEIIAQYSRRGRHYHTLLHIEQLLQLSHQYAHELEDTTVVDLAIFYHDIVYKVPGSDNERKSARLAEKRLRQLLLPETVIAEVALFIEATKTHEPVETAHFRDLCYFLDFDMSTLAADWSEYSIYIKNIRAEYMFYPDLLYNPGRAGFLKQTLAKEHFFHTEAFRFLEPKARQNMERELSMYI
jgi:predicted metal-dependent HD superfamily phosphohydrolase